MSKINIIFNNTTYSIDKSSLVTATTELTSHLSTTMSGSGATINFNGVVYNIDAEKLSTARNDLVSHLGTISGSGEKVVINDIEYEVNSSKVEDTITALHAAFDVLQSGGKTVRLLTSDGYYLVASDGTILIAKE